ncbi:unnamed protein product [Gongylonema pulchrum]|uniref:Secreted protein n=1 Tax=Gongylonema pulchrum TaxID=637853 RepID=A0A183EKL5_9BILA|nr:unnamed protein product [Gongylonema pulchrum]
MASTTGLLISSSTRLAASSLKPAYTIPANNSSVILGEIYFLKICSPHFATVGAAASVGSWIATIGAAVSTLLPPGRYCRGCGAAASTLLLPGRYCWGCATSMSVPPSSIVG